MKRCVLSLDRRFHGAFLVRTKAVDSFKVSPSAATGNRRIPNDLVVSRESVVAPGLNERRLRLGIESFLGKAENESSHAESESRQKNLFGVGADGAA